jgi:septal ring factor EnvC (AmiA/AmiB activator)
MKIDNEIISRLIRAIKNEDDPKLLFKLEMSDIQLASSLNTQKELNDQRNELIDQREVLTQQRDELTQQRDELTQQRD